MTTISIAMSALLTGLAVLAAPWFATTMGDADAASVVRVMSWCVLINGVVAVPAAVMQRYFRQDQRMVADQTNTWVGAGVSIGLAVLGMGAMSLAVGRLAGALTGRAVLPVQPDPVPLGLGSAPWCARSCSSGSRWPGPAWWPSPPGSWTS